MTAHINIKSFIQKIVTKLIELTNVQFCNVPNKFVNFFLAKEFFIASEFASIPNKGTIVLDKIASGSGKIPMWFILAFD